MQILMCLFFGQVAELVDAKVSKTFGAIPRAGSIPALTTNGEIKQDTANLIIKINFILVFLITPACFWASSSVGRAHPF